MQRLEVSVAVGHPIGFVRRQRVKISKLITRFVSWFHKAFYLCLEAKRNVGKAQNEVLKHNFRDAN